LDIYPVQLGLLFVLQSIFSQRMAICWESMLILMRLKNNGPLFIRN
jgi:hypothetical protein